ncbi:MAG TPA: TPM domain-containing protein, partial [Candidatus Acidoferrales bacterium]|nr:TPM domain-containing protein [Candidatus Acidoferrales bacterium]
MLLGRKTRIHYTSRGTLLCQTRRLGVLAVLLLALATPVRAEKLSALKHQGCVNDFAHVLDSNAQSRISALCNELYEKTGAALVVVTIRSTEETPIQQFSVDLYQQWGIGKKGEDRGVLFLLAVSDHKYWTAVGYGLEPILPDGKVGGFGRDMRPLLQQGNYSAAVLQISTQIASVIAQDRGVTLTNAGPITSARGSDHGGSFPTRLIAYLVIAVVFVIFHLIAGAFRFLRGGPQYRRKARGLSWWLLGGGSGGGGGSWGGGGFG